MQETDTQLGALEARIRDVMHLPPEHRIAMMELVRELHSVQRAQCYSAATPVLARVLPCQCPLRKSNL